MTKAELVTILNNRMAEGPFTSADLRAIAYKYIHAVGPHGLGACGLNVLVDNLRRKRSKAGEIICIENGQGYRLWTVKPQTI